MRISFRERVAHTKSKFFKTNKLIVNQTEQSLTESLQKIKKEYSFKEFLIDIEKHAAKALFVTFVGIIYALSVLGFVPQSELTNFILEFSFFVTIAFISAYTMWYNNKNKEHISLLESDMKTMSKHNNDTVDMLMQENIRQENNFYELLSHYEDLVDFGTLLYSEDEHKVIAINNYFQKIFGISLDELNSKLVDLTETESLLKIITILSYETDIKYNKDRMQSFIATFTGRDVLELYLYRVMNSHKTVCPFKVAIFKLDHSPNKSYQMIFIDLTRQKSIDDLLQMHYQTILQYTKELMRRDMEATSVDKFIVATHNYQKRIKISKTANK